MKGTLAISWGPYGGFYFYHGFTWRLCLGWIAVTFIRIEIDEMLTSALATEKDRA